MKFNLSRRGVLGGILGAIAGCCTGSFVQARAILGLAAAPAGVGSDEPSEQIKKTYSVDSYDKNSNLISTQVVCREGETTTVFVYDKEGILIKRYVEEYD